MVKRVRIRAFVDQVVTRFQPERVILFGSYAYGHPTKDSDVDLLVVMKHEGHSAVKAAEIRKSVRAGFPLDVIVRSPQTIRQRLADGDTFVKEVFERGQPLYEAHDKGVD